VLTHVVRPLLLSVVLSFVPIAAAAAEITGRIVDPDSRPVPGVTVFALRDFTVIATTLSDGHGSFTLRVPDEGRMEIRVSIHGFRAAPRTVDAGRDGLDIGTIALAISAQTESVVVSAAQTEVPLSTTASSVTVITGEQLLSTQAESLPDALRSVPGLTVASSGGRGAISAVFPRGGEADYSLVLVDGVPANAFGGAYDFAHLPLVNIDRIEIVRGPQSALYGANAIGSVIRVITKRGGSPSANASIEGGSFDTSRITAATAGERNAWQWGASAERLASDGLNGTETAAGEIVRNDDYTRHSLAASGGWVNDSGAVVRGNLHFEEDERGFPGPFGSDPGGSFGGIDDISRGNNDRWLAAIAAASPAGRRVRVQAQLTHGRIDSRFDSPFGGSESWSRRTTGRLQSDIALRRSLDASVGAEVQRERVGSTFITAADSRELPVERSLFGAFGELCWNRRDTIFVTSGLRIERIARDALPENPDAFSPRPPFGDQTVVSVNPKIAAAWFVRSGGGNYTKIRGSAGTGIRPPDGFEIAFTDNPDLQPERSRSFDLGLDQALADGRLLIESTAFYNRFDDLLVAVGSFSGASRFRTDNISNARARGLELAGTVRTRWNAARTVDLQVRLAYTLLDTEILAVDREQEAPPPFTPGDALLRRPKHQFALDAFVQSGPIAAFLHGGGRSRVLDVEPTLGTFGGLFHSAGYSVWNAGATWSVTSQLSVFGRIDNIFDRAYEEVFGFPALPRAFVAGVRVAAGR
jgi:outer membrane cobalamin receptor